MGNKGKHDAPGPCDENNPWAPVVPNSPPADDSVLSRIQRVVPASNCLSLSLEEFVRGDKGGNATDLDAREYARAAEAGPMSFHAVGYGGHGPVEYLWRNCDGSSAVELPPPFPATFSPGVSLPDGRSLSLVAYSDQDFGFLSVAIDLGQRTLTGTFQTTHRGRRPGAGSYLARCVPHRP